MAASGLGPVAPGVNRERARRGSPQEISPEDGPWRGPRLRARPLAPPPPPSSRGGTGGGRRDLEAAEGDVIAGLFVQSRRRRPTVIRPLRRGVGGPNGTLFFQIDRGAAAEHVDPGS